jgi:hypothetical protein
MERVVAGLSDEDGIKVLCYLILVRLADVAPLQVAPRECCVVQLGDLVDALAERLSFSRARAQISTALRRRFSARSSSSPRTPRRSRTLSVPPSCSAASSAPWRSSTAPCPTRAPRPSLPRSSPRQRRCRAARMRRPVPRQRARRVAGPRTQTLAAPPRPSLCAALLLRCSPTHS